MKASFKVVIAGLAVVLASSFSASSSAQDSGQEGEVTLPSVQSQGQIEFITGGVGKEERDAILRAAKSWPLLLELAQVSGPGADYISDVQIKIKDKSDKSGNAVLDATVDGPYVLVKLPPGKYGIDATYESRTIHRDETVQRGQNKKVTLIWPASQ
jgi:hypothetical protein